MSGAAKWLNKSFASIAGNDSMLKLGGGFMDHLLVKAGKICYIKDGKNIRFKPEDLDDYEKHSYVRRNYGTVQTKRQ